MYVFIKNTDCAGVDPPFNTEKQTANGCVDNTGKILKPNPLRTWRSMDKFVLRQNFPSNSGNSANTFVNSIFSLLSLREHEY
jgi:hypothetical protein